MQANAELRIAWRANWLRSIREIADLREQRATWLNPAAINPHFTFVECMSSYFDDLVLAGDDGYAPRIAEGLLSADEVGAVETLHLMLSAYLSPRR